MIDFPIIDTHLHLWDPDRLSYPWLQDNPRLNRAYLPSDYRQACGPYSVEGMVFVQCECDFAQYRQEAEWVSALAATEEPRIRGMVPWAPLEKGEAARNELAALAGNPLTKGIRRIIQFEPDLEFCLRPDFVRGVQMLADFDLSFDICIAHHQMEPALQLVRQCPQVRFIVDHIAKPDIKGGVLEPWQTHLRWFAALPNVWCKVSGLIVEADLENWRPEDLKPYLDHVLDCFGFDRVLFGGDWPVVRMAGELRQWLDALDWALAEAAPSDRRKLLHDNAVTFYRLS